MELETINKLYLELSQVATARPARVLALESALAGANLLMRTAARAPTEGDDPTGERAKFREWLNQEIKIQDALLYPASA